MAAISAALASIATAAVSFGLLTSSTAAALVTAAVSVVSVAFIVANELRHHTLALLGQLPPK